MSSDTLIDNVSDTAFWVACYRAKETERSNAIFHDPLAKRLAGDRGKKISDSMGPFSRYTEWSVVSRTIIIDRFIEALVREGVDAVINLGCGLDTRPYRLSLPPAFDWIEADYPGIISYKSEVLAAERPSCKLSRVEVDLADDEKRRAFLAQAVPQAKKVLVLTEGVIPYLSPEQVTDLANDLSAQPRFAYWITEYFHPRAYRYLKSTAWTAKMRNAPFKFYPEDWFGFFRKLGWTEKETRYPGEVALEFHRKPPMPKWARLIMPFLPARVKEELRRMSGYVVFERFNRR